MSAAVHVLRPHTGYTVCGREFDLFKYHGAKRVTRQKDEATCQKCLRLLQRIEAGAIPRPLWARRAEQESGGACPVSDGVSLWLVALSFAGAHERQTEVDGGHS